jgi:hypothetical protein
MALQGAWSAAKAAGSSRKWPGQASASLQSSAHALSDSQHEGLGGGAAVLMPLVSRSLKWPRSREREMCALMATQSSSENSSLSFSNRDLGAGEKA